MVMRVPCATKSQSLLFFAKILFYFLILTQFLRMIQTELSDEKLKNKVLNTMIDISDQQYGTAIRKKYLPNQSNKSNNKE